MVEELELVAEGLGISRNMAEQGEELTVVGRYSRDMDTGNNTRACKLSLHNIVS